LAGEDGFSAYSQYLDKKGIEMAEYRPMKPG
jgi:hypothetical protein